MRARPPAPGARGFRHEAFFYVDDDGYASAVAAFLRAGLEADEPVMAVLPAPRHEWLLSRAFAADPLLWLVCPYDASGLDAADLAVARRLHPGVFDPADVVR